MLDAVSLVVNTHSKLNNNFPHPTPNYIPHAQEIIISKYEAPITQGYRYSLWLNSFPSNSAENILR